MRKQLFSLLKSNEVRKLSENFLSLSALKVVNSAIPFITLPYLIRVLGFNNYGVIVLALSLIAYFQSICDYGFNLSASREIVKNKKNNEKLSYIYSKTILSKIVLLYISLCFFYSIVFFVPLFSDDHLIYILMSLILIGQTLFPEWFFRGIEEMKFIAIIDFIIKSFFCIGVFCFISKPSDLWLYPFLYGVSYIFVGILSHLFIIKKYNLQLLWIGFFAIKTNLKNGFPLFVNQFVPNLYSNLSGILIGLFVGKVEVGVFGVLRQVITLINVFNSVVISVFYPYILRKQNFFNIFSKYYFSIVLILLIFLYLTKPIILTLLFNVESVYYYIFDILLIGMIGRVLYSIFSTMYLVARGYDIIVMQNTIIISLIGLVVSWPLISGYGLLGAAIAISSSQILLGLFSIIYFLKLRS